MSLVGMDPRETERAEMEAAYQAFLARGGRPERLPVGAMAHNAATMKRTALPTSSQVSAGVPPTPPESVPVTGVHRIPNVKRHQQPTPRSPGAVAAARATEPTRSPVPVRKGRGAAAKYTKTAVLLAVLRSGWQHVTELAKATNMEQDSTSAMLTQLRYRGLVISHGQRPRMLWALPGTKRPDTPDSSTPPEGEFEGLTDQQLREKRNALQVQVREAQRLRVRIERELTLRRKRAIRAAA